MADLWWITAPEPLSLRRAVSSAATVFESGATALLSSPDDHLVATLVAGELRTAAGPCDLDPVFAARLFAPPGELRWLHTADGLGQAVLLAERPGLIAGWDERQADVVESLPNSYALWGRRLEPLAASGWVRAVEGRIGWIDVPVTGQPLATAEGQDWPDQYVTVETVEYFGHDDHHNLFLTDERLVRLALTEPSSGRDSLR